MRAFFALLIGLALGIVGGMVGGWYFPLDQTTSDYSDLHPDYQADYLIMVGAAYAENGDWDEAQQRIGALGLNDPAGQIVSLTERYIDQGRNPDDIRYLARLADRYGYRTPAMEPYLPAEGQ